MAGLHLQGGLPEEQIGLMVVPNTATIISSASWPSARPGRGGLADQGWPVHLDGEGDRDIGQQCQRQPFEPAHVGLITHVHLQRQAERAETRRIQPYRPPATRCTACAIAAISAARLSVLAVSSSPTTAHSTIGGKSRLMLAARPRRVTQPMRADELDRDHQRQRQRHGPQHRVAELRAGLGIGGDAAGIVVRRAGDQAGAQRGRADGRGLAPARASRPSRILQPWSGHRPLRISSGSRPSARAGQLPVALRKQALAGGRGAATQARHALEHIHRQAVAVDAVEHREFERRIQVPSSR